ncbi:hypothetical protein [Methylobacterium sp. P1-11]|uniref:hypothetical protein n=1 Tax=Methylobacterium sp. P1-11 TaxID=2024616 RepID=UPI001563C3FA|nr:hypothetical protein [Methylobacterium sp. P1-11]
MSRGWICVGVVGVVAVSPMAAFASGQLPAQTMVEVLASDTACLDTLRALAAEDRRQVAPKSAMADGMIREVSLDTSGVERTGPASARYDATLWWHNGTPRTDRPQVETSHSYSHRIRECDGRVLRTTGEDGYTSSTFAPSGPAAPR